MSSLYSDLPLHFQTNRKEWDQFWSWMWENTDNHGFGPLRTLLYQDPREQMLCEREMCFFLIHKNKILNDPPTGDAKRKFNDMVMKI